MRQCSSCGAEVTPEDSYCSECGADLSEPDAIQFDVDSDEILSRLQDMDEIRFERFVADLWEELGWETRVTQASADAGIDVVAEKKKPYPQKQLLQVKRYSPGTTVSSSDVQQYAALKQQKDDVDASVIVTTSSFSRDAEERGRELNVKLIDGEQLLEIIDDLDAYKLLEEYLDFSEQETEEAEKAMETVEKTIGNEAAEQVSPVKKTVQGELSVPDTKWRKGVMAATGGWIITLFGINVLPDVLGGFLVLFSWFLLPISLYKDIGEVQNYVDWPKHKWLYIIISLIWIIAIVPGFVYLWKRHNLTKDESDEVTVETETPTTEDTGSGQTQVETRTDDSVDLDDDSGFEINKMEHNGSSYSYQYSDSPNGKWRTAYGRSYDTEQDRFFLFKNGELQATEPIEHAGVLEGKAAVSNNGVAAVIDDLGQEELSGKLYVFDSSGEQLLTHLFNRNLETCAVSPDGGYAAAATLNPDCSTYIFDIENGRQVLKHEHINGNKKNIEFRREEDDLRLFLFEDRDDKPLYAIDLEGDVVWKSEELQRQQRLQELMNSSNSDDLEEALDKLEEAYELTEEENEKKNVAEKLADTHWSLAKNSEYDTDEWWQHLNQAKAYYTEVLPWYDGKQGVAKVSRKQGKYHLKQGNEDTALELFQNIKDLEEEYDVQLLTDADKRRIEELSQDP